MKVRLIDANVLRDNLTDIYEDENGLVYLKDVLDLIDKQPAPRPISREQSRVGEWRMVPGRSDVFFKYYRQDKIDPLAKFCRLLWHIHHEQSHADGDGEIGGME